MTVQGLLGYVNLANYVGGFGLSAFRLQQSHQQLRLFRQDGMMATTDTFKEQEHTRIYSLLYLVSCALGTGLCVAKLRSPSIAGRVFVVLDTSTYLIYASGAALRCIVAFDSTKSAASTIEVARSENPDNSKEKLRNEQRKWLVSQTGVVTAATELFGCCWYLIQGRKSYLSGALFLGSALLTGSVQIGTGLDRYYNTNGLP